MAQFTLRRFLGGLAVAGLLCGLPYSAQTQDIAPVQKTPEELRFGSTLFHYYQQNYFDALVELMAGQTRENLGAQAAEASLLRGAVQLSYGMDEAAREEFDSVLDAQWPAATRDRAWFYLGKLAWQRHDASSSAAALARLSPGFSGSHADEAHYLRAVQAMFAGDDASAQQEIARLSSPCPWLPYFHYNGAVQLAGEQRWEAAATAFRAAAASPCDDEEGLSLQDKALTAAGYAGLAQAELYAASDDFVRVRLSGSEADRALLGYGWSHARREEFPTALAAWQTLSERDLVSASAREALLALPYAYEQLKRPTLALNSYRAADAALGRELRRVESALNALDEENLQELLGMGMADGANWLGSEELPPRAPHGPFLLELLSTDDAQMAMRELRDLYAIEQRLEEDQRRLSVLQQVDADQRAVWDSVRSGDRVQTLRQRQSALLAQRDQLQQRLREAEAAGDGRLLASPEQQQRWQRVARAERSASALGDADKQRRLRLIQGLMAWQDNEEFPHRRWQLSKQLQELDDLVRDSEEGLRRLDVALQTRKRAPFASRLQALNTRGEALLPKVSDTRARAEQQLRQMASQALEGHRVQIVRGLSQARVAIARLYDSAAEEPQS